MLCDYWLHGLYIPGKRQLVYVFCIFVFVFCVTLLQILHRVKTIQETVLLLLDKSNIGLIGNTKKVESKCKTDVLLQIVFSTPYNNNELKIFSWVLLLLSIMILAICIYKSNKYVSCYKW